LPSAEAAIVFSGPVNITVPLTTAGVYLNVVTGATGVTSTTQPPGWDVNLWSATTLNLFNPAAPTGGVYQGSAGNFNLAVGTIVSGAGPFSSGLFTNAPNLNSSNNYFGFRFVNEALGGQIQYGWVQVRLGATLIDPSRAIVGYAYENTGGSIAVGAVPEPSTYALFGVMAVGALGMRAWRARKAA
jgi:hypothetical protein